MKKTISILMTLLLLMIIVPCGSAAETDIAESGTTVSVSKSDITKSGFVSAVQKALDTAKSKATVSNPYTVKAPAGKYDLTSVLRIYSNTTLDLTGVTLTRTKSGNMLRVGAEDTVNTGATGYDYYKNVAVLGGTFDGKLGGNTIIKAFHTTNFTMNGCTLLNEKNGHMTEFAGVDGLNILNCTFKDQLLDKGKNGYEAVQLDVLHPYHVTGARCEDLCCKNVLVEGCSFDNVPRGVGSHTSVLNNPHTYITIRGNRFTNIKSIAIQGLDWNHADIRSNYIDNAPRGITLYSAGNGKTYLPKVLDKKGGVSHNRPNTNQYGTDGYGMSFVNIAYNELHNIGTSADPYAWYSSQGIAVLGAKLSGTSPVDSTDESGGLPAGNYLPDNVEIHDNYIDIRGNGIRTEYTVYTDVSGNEINCTKNTVVKDNYYGVVMRNMNCKDGIKVWNNCISGAEVNGIQLDHVLGGASVGRNRVNNSGKYGIACYSSELDCIYENFVNGCPNAGIKTVSGTTVRTIDHNRVTASAANGIHIDSDCSCNIVEWNLVYDCGGYIQYTRSKGLVNMGYNYSEPVPAEKINFGGDGVNMGVGTLYMPEQLYDEGDIVGSYTYSIRDADIARVDKNGMITALHEGSTEIEIIADSGASLLLPLLVSGGYENDPHMTENPILLGDADGEGHITVVDATLVQRYCADFSVDHEDMISERCDVNSDGLIDIDDATFIQRAVIGIETPYPIGHPMN